MQNKILFIIFCILLLTTTIHTVESLKNITINSKVPNYVGECNLYFSNISFNPNPPECMSYLYIFLNVSDKLGNYDYSYVDINLISDIPINYTRTIPFDDQVHDIYFKWPDSKGTYYIELTVIPDENSNWNEINWNDNTYILNNLSPNITPIFFLGSIKNITNEGNIIRFNAKSIMYIEESLTRVYLTNNELITLPKSPFSIIGKKFLIGLFL